MPYVVMATLVARTDTVDAVGAHLAALVPASRDEPGCLHYEVLRSHEAPTTFVVHERYVDEASFAAHRETDHFREHLTTGIVPLLESRSAAVYELVPTPVRVALVFGGASGINRATSALLAAQGCAVVVADRDRTGADATVADIVAAAGTATAADVDVADRAAVVACVQDVVAAHGRLDVLVTGAGHLELCPIDELTEDVFDRMVAVHLKGTVNAVQAALPALRSSGRGRVVCLSSVAARRGSADHHHYAAAKAGIVGFVRSIAVQEAAHGVTVNAVLPGPIDTAMLGALSAERRAQMAGSVPVGRLGTAEDVARAVAFFADPDGGFVTGTTLTVAGGSAL